MSKSGDRVEHGRGTLWHLILAGLECGPRLFEGLEVVESAGSSNMHHRLYCAVLVVLVHGGQAPS